MENLYRAHLEGPKIKERASAVQNPIILDNRAFDIENGDTKSLDYLDYYGTIAKSSLAAEGIIKLCPMKDNFKYGYGAIAHPVIKTSPPEVEEAQEEEFGNEWDNIFLKRLE